MNLRRLALGMLALMTAAAVVMVASAPSGARANGIPVMVQLSYIDLSNWGPQDATGTAELIFAEGIVRINADALPHLDGQVYQAWLVNSAVGDAISMGRFNASPSGAIAYQGTLPPIADFGFDLVILTVEPDPDDAPQPSSNRSLGGYFSLLGQPSPDGSLEGGSVGQSGIQTPGELPNTGVPGWTSDVIRFSALLAAMGLSVVVGLRLSRRHA